MKGSEGGWMVNSKRMAKSNRIARRLFKLYYRFYPEHYSPTIHKGFKDGIEGHFGALRKTKVFCSDPGCCGNPRRIKGKKKDRLTIQEQKAPTIGEEWY